MLSKITPKNTSSPYAPDQNPTVNERETIIITDSMLDDVHTYFDKNIKVTVIPYNGKNATFIADQIDRILIGKKPSEIAIHCGTNSLEGENMHDIEMAFNKIINNAVWHTDAHILLSGVIHRLDKPWLNGRIDTINAHLQSLESHAITFIDHNATFRNLSRVLDGKGLHLKPSGKRQVPENIWLAVNAARHSGLSAPQQAWRSPPQQH